MLMLGLFLVSMIPVAVLAENNSPQTAAELRVAREEHKQKVAEFKLQFRENKNEFKAKRLELRDRRTSYTECKATSGETSQECIDLKNELLGSSKDFMKSSLDMVIPWVQSAIENLESLELTSKASQKEQAIADLKADLAELEDLKGHIEGWSITPSEEDVKEVGKDVAMSIRAARLDVKYGLGLVIQERFDTLFYRLGETTYPTLDSVVADLKAAGVDTAEMESNLVEMKSNVELAEQAYNAALPHYESARAMAVPAQTREEAKAAFEEAKVGFESYKDARDYLRQARENLRTAVRLMKQAPNGQAILESKVEANLL